MQEEGNNSNRNEDTAADALFIMLDEFIAQQMNAFITEVHEEHDPRNADDGVDQCKQCYKPHSIGACRKKKAFHFNAGRKEHHEDKNEYPFVPATLVLHHIFLRTVMMVWQVHCIINETKYNKQDR